MSALEEVLRQAARESGRMLADLGVRPGDEEWMAEHAAVIASLAGEKRRGRRKASFLYPLYRLARRAARTAR
jgi:hypothetical protein